MPGFIRDLANSILVNPRMNVLQVNKRLHHLGWDGFDLDECTLQLAIACFGNFSISSGSVIASEAKQSLFFSEIATSLRSSQ